VGSVSIFAVRTYRGRQWKSGEGEGGWVAVVVVIVVVVVVVVVVAEAVQQRE